MMLDWLGMAEESARIHRAVESVLTGGHRTADLGGSVSTTDMGNRILDAIV
jgi:isocitrate/isopropylmalate dehydrogenase